MGHRHVASALSLGLVLLSIVALGWRGLEFGIEFTGGALFDVRFPQPIALEQLRGELADSPVRGASLQLAGSDREIVIRLPVESEGDIATLATALESALVQVQPGASIVNSELIGPAIGEELRDSAGLGAIGSFAVLGVYVMFRFAGKFAIGAIASLVHDVIVTLGFFALSGMKFDMPAFAALLAIIGYSLNDTIVVYDRVRENLRSLRGATPLQAINQALNRTLERTLVMSATTLFTVLALLLFGGNALRSFSSALTVGVVVGTYSSIYVASSLLVSLGVTRSSLLPPESTADEAHP